MFSFPAYPFKQQQLQLRPNKEGKYVLDRTEYYIYSNFAHSIITEAIAPERVKELDIDADLCLPENLDVFPSLQVLSIGVNIRYDVSFTDAFRLPLSTREVRIHCQRVNNLEHLIKLPQVEKLSLVLYSEWTSQLTKLTQLRKLDLHKYDKVPLGHTTFDISPMVNLIKLRCHLDDTVHLKGLEKLTKLTTLDLTRPRSQSSYLTPELFRNLTNLRSLSYDVEPSYRRPLTEDCIPDNIDALHQLQEIRIAAKLSLPASVANIRTLHRITVYDIECIPESMLCNHVVLKLLHYKPFESWHSKQVDKWSIVNNALLQRIQQRLGCPVSLVTIVLRWINSHREMFATDLNLPIELLERIKIVVESSPSVGDIAKQE